jgi:hypothetical protein
MGNRFSASYLVAPLLVATAMIAGCSMTDSKPPADGEPSIGALLNITDPKTFSRPLDPYRVALENQLNASKAELVLAYRCLRGFGFDRQPPTATENPPPRNAGLFGIVDEQMAQVRGYHPAAEPKDRDKERQAGELPPAARAVMMGQGQSSYQGKPVPEGGCIGEARRKIAEGAPNIKEPRLADNLAIEAYDRSKQDSRVVKVYAEWSACMKQAGFDYADPWKALNDPAFVTPEPTQKEITVATADARCKSRTNLLNVHATVLTAYEQRAVERNAEALSQIKQSYEIQEKNAAAVLAGQ